MLVANTRYRLRRPLGGIRLNPLNGQTGKVDCLPTGSVFTVVGPSAFYSMINVRTADELFAFFEEDIRNCGDLIPWPASTLNQHVATRSSGA